MMDYELAELLGKHYPYKEPVVNLDTSTPLGRAWRLWVLQKPLREWQAKKSLRDYNSYFDQE